VRWNIVRVACATCSTFARDGCLVRGLSDASRVETLHAAIQRSVNIGGNFVVSRRAAAVARLPSKNRRRQSTPQNQLTGRRSLDAG